MGVCGWRLGESQDARNAAEHVPSRTRSFTPHLLPMTSPSGRGGENGRRSGVKDGVAQVFGSHAFF